MILFFTIEGETNTFYAIMIILRKNDFDLKKGEMRININVQIISAFETHETVFFICKFELKTAEQPWNNKQYFWGNAEK